MFNNNVGSCEWDLLRKPLSILIFTEIYINWDLNYTLPLYFYSFFLGGGGGGGGGFFFFFFWGGGGEDSTFLFQVLARI